MTEKRRGSKKTSKWIDPDDAPELTRAALRRGVWSSGARPVVSRAASDPKSKEITKTESVTAARAAFKKALGRPVGSGHKTSVTIRLDRTVVSSFRATGKGWQTRIDAALKQWLKRHDPAKL